VRKAAPTRKLAEAIERDAKVRELRGEVDAHNAKPDIRLEAFIQKYLELYEVTKTVSTRTRDGYALQRITAFLGDPPIRRISQEILEAYMAERRRSVSASTVNRELDLIKSLLNRAVEWGYLRASPGTSIKKYPTEMLEPRFLAPDEGARLIGAAYGQMKGFIVAGLNAGLRKGELFDLTWDDANFERRELRVRKAKGKRFRVIPMNELLWETLKRHPRHITSTYVFHNPDGSQWKDIRGSFNAALERAGLPRMRIHDMRHTFVSNLFMAGTDARTVQELAGHREIKTTMRYAHLTPGHLRNSVERLRWVNMAAGQEQAER
jgi:integrase